MTTVLYVMLIWGGSVHAGPAIVQNFSSLKICEFNRPIVELGFKSLNTDSLGHPDKAVKTVCMALVNKLD